MIIQILGCFLLDIIQPNYEQWMFSINDNPTVTESLFDCFPPMKQEILGVECSEYMKIKSVSMSFLLCLSYTDAGR